jgi:hypothetical protein
MKIKCPNCGYDLDREIKTMPFGGYCPNCGVQLVMTKKSKFILILITLSVLFIIPSIYRSEKIGRLMIWISMGVVFVLPMLLNRAYGFKADKNSKSNVLNRVIHDQNHQNLEQKTNVYDSEQALKRFPYKLANIATIFSLMFTTLVLGLFVTTKILVESNFTSIIASLFGNIFMMLIVSIFLVLGESKFLYNIISVKKKRFHRILIWFSFSYIFTSFFFNSLVNVIVIVDTIALVTGIMSLLIFRSKKT